MVSVRHDPRPKDDASAKIFKGYKSGNGKPEICQLLAVGKLRKTIFDTFPYLILPLLLTRPNR